MVDTVTAGLEIARLVADTFEGDVQYLDAAKAVYGTDSDVDVGWNNTDGLLEYTDGTDPFLTLDPAAAKSTLVFPSPGATSTDYPVSVFYRPQDADVWSVGQHANWPIARVDFDAQDGGAIRHTFVRLTVGVPGLASSVAPNVESSGFTVEVMNDGALDTMAKFQGQTAPLVPGGWDRQILWKSWTVHDGNYALMVGTNKAAFVYIGDPTAGYFFQAGNTSPANGHEFRGGGGAVYARLTTDGAGALLLASGTSATPRGVDTLTAGSLALGRLTATDVSCWTDFKLPTVGTGFGMKEGTNAKSGVATLVAGNVTVATTKASATMRVKLSRQTVGGTAGFLDYGTLVAGTSFDINSTSATDTSVVYWQIWEPT